MSPAPGRVVVVGANGFVGSAVCAALLRRGHAVTAAVREPARVRFPDGCNVVAMDLSRASAGDWAPVVAGVGAVVNAAGALTGDLAALQSTGPAALFEACAAAGVPSVVQVSALGAGERPASTFLSTKAVADDGLLSMAEARPGWHVVRPSVVIGRGGATTGMFTAMASLPRPLRLGGGPYRLQPVHVDELACIVANLAAGCDAPALVEVGGPMAMDADALVAVMRAWLGLRPARPVTVPGPLLGLAAAVGHHFPGSALTPETLALMRAGSVVTRPTPFAAVRVRPLAEALAADPARHADLVGGRMAALRPILLACLALVWLGGGVASLLVSAAGSDRLLAGLGLSGTAARLVTLSGAVLDLALGAALAFPRLRLPALKAQIAAMAAYTALGSVALPSLWADPFGPLAKNAAVLAATLALVAAES